MAVLEPALMIVANAVAGVFTWTDRLLGKTAATTVVDDGEELAAAQVIPVAVPVQGMGNDCWSVNESDPEAETAELKVPVMVYDTGDPVTVNEKALPLMACGVPNVVVNEPSDVHVVPTMWNPTVIDVMAFPATVKESAFP